MTRPLAVKPSGWRVARPLIGAESARWQVRRRGFRLTVRVTPSDGMGGLWRIEAFLSNAPEPQRRVWCDVRPEWLEEQILRAKLWCESRADELAATIANATAGVL